MNTLMAGAWRSKTLWAALALAVAGVIADNMETLKPYFGEYGGLAGVAWAVVMAVLRILTTTSIADKAPPPDDGSDSGA